MNDYAKMIQRLKDMTSDQIVELLYNLESFKEATKIYEAACFFIDTYKHPEDEEISDNELIDADNRQRAKDVKITCEHLKGPWHEF